MFPSPLHREHRFDLIRFLVSKGRLSTTGKTRQTDRDQITFLGRIKLRHNPFCPFLCKCEAAANPTRFMDDDQISCSGGGRLKLVIRCTIVTYNAFADYQALVIVVVFQFFLFYIVVFVYV